MESISVSSALPFFRSPTSCLLPNRVVTRIAWLPSPSLQQQTLRGALGALNCERLSCGCAVEMGVYSVEEAPAQAKERSALASPTARRAGEEQEGQVRETDAILAQRRGSEDHTGVR